MGMSDELQKLHHLKEQGVLTEEEFAAAKKRVIDGEPTHTTDAQAASQRTQSEPRPSVLNEFRLSSRDRWLGGVCGGLAVATGLASWIWRLVFLGLALCGGTGFVLYLLAWFLVPLAERPLPPSAQIA